jgi:hypothetical protein
MGGIIVEIELERNTNNNTSTHNKTGYNKLQTIISALDLNSIGIYLTKILIFSSISCVLSCHVYEKKCKITVGSKDVKKNILALLGKFWFRSQANLPLVVAN